MKTFEPQTTAHVSLDAVKEVVCLHARKIYDTCREKDSLSDLRVYFPRPAQTVIDGAVNVKGRKAELIWCGIGVERVAFNRGFYSVDIRYYYRVTSDAYTGAGSPAEVSGLAVFDKRVILFGSEGSAKTYSSTGSSECAGGLPVAAVEAVDPVLIDIKLTRSDEPQAALYDIPDLIKKYFQGDLLTGDCEKYVYCTLGQFSIIRLERGAQLIMPCVDFCMPKREFAGGAEGGPCSHPCDIFKRIEFPVDEFFPPVTGDFTDYR
jgi:hypothetical protein